MLYGTIIVGLSYEVPINKNSDFHKSWEKDPFCELLLIY